MGNDLSPHFAAATTAWSGHAEIGPGWARFVGHAGDNRAHRHHALQLAIGDGPSIRMSINDRWIEAPGLLIGADVVHALDPGPVHLLYLERESALGRQLATACPSGVFPLPARICAVLRTHWLKTLDPADCVPAMVAELTHNYPEPQLASATAQRVLLLIESLRQRPLDAWNSHAMAADSKLSPSRFAHLFKAQAGMAVRPYLRWLRLERALAQAARGASLTDAAHAAGFSDAAHFSRTMRAHFGIAPKAILSALRSGRSTHRS